MLFLVVERFHDTQVTEFENLHLLEVIHIPKIQLFGRPFSSALNLFIFVVDLIEFIRNSMLMECAACVVDGKVSIGLNVIY